mgnify:CR=1 FL=1
MMNYIFAFSVVFSFITAVLTGNAAALSEGILEGAHNAVSIAVKLLGTMALWNGISEIMTESGLHKKIEKLLTPVMKLLFPTYQGTAAGEAICSNITANLLGLGNAATPLGVEAMRRIKAQSGNSFADNETVRFVVINSAALTLIPTSIASLRRLSGSTAPFSVILPVWLTGMLSLTVGLLVEKILSKRWKI